METIVVDHKPTIQIHLRAIITDQAEGVPATTIDVQLASPAHDKVVTTASLPTAARGSNVNVPVIGHHSRPPVSHLCHLAHSITPEQLTLQYCTSIAARTAARATARARTAAWLAAALADGTTILTHKNHPVPGVASSVPPDASEATTMLEDCHFHFV
jgi:hypothetical protein